MSGKNLPRDIITMDSKGRITVPQRFREALGIKQEKTAIQIEIFPSLEKPKALIIKKLGGSS